MPGGFMMNQQDAAASPVAEKLAALIRFPTVAGEHEDAAAFEGLRNALDSLYPLTAKDCERHLVAGRGVVWRWQGRTKEKPWVLMAHYDVVPSGETGWGRPPFSGELADRTVYGRGTLDTKGTLAAMLQAAEELIAGGFKPERDIIFCFSGDEETYGPTTGEIIRFLKENGHDPDFVLDEGGKMDTEPLPGFKGLAAMVGCAEKGMAQLRLSVTGPGGHASRPPRETQTDILVRAMAKLRRKPWRMRLTPLVKECMQALSPGCGPLYQMMYRYPALFRPLLFWQFDRLAEEKAPLLRTTCALTQLKGSEASNVLPDVARAGYNLRLLPGDTLESVAEHARRAVNDGRVKVEVLAGNDPSPVSETAGPAFQRIRQAAAVVWPGALTAPALMVGATDAYYYSLFCPQVYRFSPLKVSAEESAAVHAANERVPVKALEEAVTFYQELIRNG